MAKTDRLLLGGVLLVGLLLRLWGSTANLPYIFHADEPDNIRIIQTIFKTGDLNPHFFNYPTLFFYINVVAYIPFFLIGYAFGQFNTVSDIAAPISIVMGTTFSPTPGAIVLSRMLSVAFGTAAIGLVYVIGRRLGSGWQGVLAAMLTAFSPTLITHSGVATPDIQLVCWVLVAVLASVLVLQRGETWCYILAGIAAGCAAGTKYNGALALVALVTAHILRHRQLGLSDPRLWLGVAASALTFFVTTPFALLDYRKFAEDVAYEARHYATGHPGAEGDTFAWYVRFLWRTEGLLGLLALVQIARGIAGRSRETIVLAAFPVCYFVLICLYVIRNERTLLPALPFVHLLGAGTVVELFRSRQKLGTPAARWLAVAGGVLALVLSGTRPILATVRETRDRGDVDGRTTARLWIDRNLPDGSFIAIESYGPFLNRTRFTFQPLIRMIDKPPEWFVTNNVDYLVFSQGMYRRFFLEPEKYSREVASYRRLFRRFPVVRVFSEGSYEVIVHQVTPDPDVR